MKLFKKVLIISFAAFLALGYGEGRGWAEELYEEVEGVYRDIDVEDRPTLYIKEYVPPPIRRRALR